MPVSTTSIGQRQHDEQGLLTALDRSPFTRRHAVFTFALLAALILDYAKPFSLSFIIPGVRATWGLSTVEGSYLAVVGLMGTMLGSFFWGFLADRVGRRVTLLWTIGIFTLSTLCGLTVAYWQTLLACFVMGFGVGGEAPIVFALAAEYLPVKVRARSLLLLGIAGATAGYALAAIIATFANVLFPVALAWRFIWLVQLLPAAFILLLRRNVVPESARFLLAKGRAGEAREAAEHLLGSIPESAAQREEPKGSPASGPSPPLYGRTVGLAFFSFAWGLANFGFVTWLPTLLENLGYTGRSSSASLSLSALIALPALAITGYLLTRWSTRWTLTAYAVGGALALVTLGISASGEVLSPLLLVATSSVVFFFITSIGGAFSVYAAEVFPTPIRARRSGVVAGVGKLGAVIGPYFGGLWLAREGSALGLQLPFAIALLLAAGVLAVSGLETRDMTLEEIDEVRQERG
jgi:putative MFS transporter